MTGTGTGIDAQFGIAEESTFGTYVAPNRHFDFVSESLKADVAKIYSKGVRNWRYQQKGSVRTYVKGAAGDVQLEVGSMGFGLIFKHMLGSAELAAAGGDKPNENIITAKPDANGLKGLSLTAQIGRPEVLTGAVIPFNYYGGKINQWSLSTAIGEQLKLGLTFDFAKHDVSNALTDKWGNFQDGYPLTFIDGTIKVGGSTVNVSAVNVDGNNNLKTDRYKIGNKKLEQLAAGELEITGSLDTEFEGLTNYNKILVGTVGELELTFAFGEIDGGKNNPYKLVVTLPAVEFVGDLPTVGGADIVQHPLKFKALQDENQELVTFEYHTTDEAI